ncbi:MAG: hypothetical protein QGH45_22305 [Myxococcota bacterium]|nr:hypothetical protein [Myxococcota bacterium]
MKCSGCGFMNDAEAQRCGQCNEPLPIGDLSNFSLTGAEAADETIAFFDHVNLMITDIVRKANATNWQVRGKDEARLARVLGRIQSELPADQFQLLTYGVEARLLKLKSSGRDVVRRVVRSVLAGVAGPAEAAPCSTPLRVSVDVAANPSEELVVLTLKANRHPDARLSDVEVLAFAEEGVEDVIKIVPPQKTKMSMEEVEERNFSYQVALKGAGEAKVRVQVRLGCTGDTKDRICACAYHSEFRWHVGVDGRNKTVVYQLQVIEPNTSIVRVAFGKGDEAERTTLDDEGEGDGIGRQQFALPLFLDIDHFETQASALYDGAPGLVSPGDGRVRAGHFLVEAGDQRRVLFVLLDDTLSLGRSDRNHIVTRVGRLNRDEKHWGFVSKRHGRLRWMGPSEGAFLADGLESGEGSTNKTEIRRGGRRRFPLDGGSKHLETMDRIEVPRLAGNVERPYALYFHDHRTWDRKQPTGKTICLTLDPDRAMHEIIQPERPYLYAWLPEADHELLVGSTSYTAVELPGVGAEQAFRLLRDEAGHLYVSPCSGVKMVHERAGVERALRPHAWYQLAGEDVLRCGEAELTYAIHQDMDESDPNLGLCYPGERGPFGPPEEFRDLLLPLMVPAE